MEALTTPTPGLLLTDGGLETTLIYKYMMDVPSFAAVSLLRDGDGAGCSALMSYFESYVSLARGLDVGVLLESATWRGSADWAAVLGVSLDELAHMNTAAVAMLLQLRDAAVRSGMRKPFIVSGCIGPRGDGYVVSRVMTAEEATEYHGFQAKLFRAAGADIVTAMTMTHVSEAVGVVRAAQAASLPAVVSFTVETDGRLPCGVSLPEAIAAVDAATDSAPLYYMVNCAHPTHFLSVLSSGVGADAGDREWLRRVGGVRPNASSKSHAELDASTQLDEGDVLDFAAQTKLLAAALPVLRVIGGCCGTDVRHVAAAVAAVSQYR
jgi:S-methylmethionine-dependent homocysteine/selenocysteine methylase